MRLPQRISRYEIIDRLGEGGMGTVYLARDPLLNRTVAIKVLTVPNSDLRQRFAREARSAASLNHLHIVTIYDIGEDDERPFIAMEYVEGETLAAIIGRRSPLPLIQKLQVILDLCRGLGHAHRAGIIHRDIKPANVILSTSGVVKILDFGLARLAADGSVAGLTAVGTLLGTPHYMSPEQIEGRSVDHRSDIFAVGLVLYELLCYRKAYPGDTPHAVIHRIMSAAPTPLGELDRTFDPGFDQIVFKATQRLPENRYQDLREFAGDLTVVRDRIHAIQTEATASFDAPEPERPAPSPGRAPRTPTPRQIPNLDAITRRRAAQIDGHLKEAAGCLQEGRLESAVELCELALVLDPTNAEALDLLQETQRGLEERQVASWLRDAETQLSKSALSEAALLIDQAVKLKPDSLLAAELQRALLERRREQEQAREQARIVADALDRARRHLAEDAPEAAALAAAEALAEDAANEEAQDFRRRAEDAIEARDRRREHERRALETVASARALATSGDPDSGLTLLRAFTPSHPLVDATAETLVVRIAEREQRARDEAAASTRALEEEKLRRGSEHDAIQLATPPSLEVRPAATLRTRIRPAMLASGLAVVMLLVVGGAIVFRTMTGNRADPTPGRSPTTDLRPLDSRPLVGWSPLVSVTAPLLPLLPLAPATDAAPEVDPVLIAAAAAAARRDFVEAIRLFLAVTATQPQNPVARDGLRNARADRQEQLARARSLIKLGDLDLEQRRYAEAIGFYNQALLEDGQNAEARVKLGRAQAAKAKADLAATEILGPKQVSSAGTQPNRAALLKQANALLETGFPDRAGAIFDELLKANPADPDALAGKEKTALLRSRQKP